MRKKEIAKILARQSRVSDAEAADQLDRVVNQIIADLKHGLKTRLPGLGEFTPGDSWGFRFDSSEGAKHGE